MNKRLDYYVALLRRPAVFGAIIGGAVAGILLIGLVRYVATPPEKETHYHANFAVFINGTRQTFKGPQYYQEVQACDEEATVLGRVHMHDQKNHVVHVHDTLVTWADFFTNMGWSLGNSVLYDGRTAYVDDDGGRLKFMLNGKEVRSIASEVIGNGDRLLISYGSGDPAALQQQYAQVEDDADQFNKTSDPAGCKGPEHESAQDRLRKAFFF